MKSGQNYLDYLDDITDAIDKVKEFTAGMDYD